MRSVLCEERINQAKDPSEGFMSVVAQLETKLRDELAGEEHATCAQ